MRGMLGHSRDQVFTAQLGSGRRAGRCEHTDGVALHAGVEGLHVTPCPVVPRVGDEAVYHALLAND
eukprot:CAMPEP_0179150408 /NCGR_PEP_ID=MMETSP0796-20121207/72945_1 /TAXON_ID=73915 /ORGANISM="Pyrodinium bahamense, Strain pbaha01" /LENGTH=65 /DNA_ID=CAMNT_0020851379 /DNA_START=125 /DNA_END=319 /DNA_ORIENTATION=+